MFAVIGAIAAVLSPTPSPSPSPPPVIATVRVATGSPQRLHELPVAASFLDAAAIAANPAMTADALLGALPGFDRDRSNSSFTNYGQLRVSFTGAGTDRGLVLADGIPAQDAFGGQIDWAEYPSADVVRAELLRGAGSALYGSGAVGGVLMLDTFAPSAMPSVTGAVSVSGGTHGALDDYVRVAVPLSKTLSASFSGSLTQEQYFDLPPAYATPFDLEAQSAESMASLRLRYAPTARDAFEYGYRGAWDSQAQGRANYDFSRRLNQHSVGYSHTSGRAALSFHTYVRDAFVVNRADSYPSDPGALRYTQYVPTNESGAALVWSESGTHSEFIARADASAAAGESSQYGSTGALQAEGSGSQRLGGLALQETFALPRSAIVAGFRGDTVSTSTSNPQTYRAISPRVAFRYDLNPHLAFRISDGAGFRAPFLNELVRGYQIGTVKYVPNAALVPERSSSLSAGLDLLAGHTQLALDAIHTYVNDAIGFRTVSATIQMRANTAHTQTDGETLTLTEQLSPTVRLRLYGTAQYARVTGGDPLVIGKRLPYVPSVAAGAGIDTESGAMRMGLTLTYTGPTFADDLNTQPLGTAVLVGAHVALPLNANALAVLDIENATSARYLSSIDRYGPPTTVTLGLTIPVSDSRLR